MIQRIQSVYLLLTTLISILFLNGSIFKFVDKSASLIKLTFANIVKVTGTGGSEMIGSVIPVSVLLILIPILALVTIFLYKKRSIQLLLTKILIVLVIIFILTLAYYSYLIVVRHSGSISADFKMILPLLMLLFSILAYRGISKDDRLVKSYDRLR